MKNKEIITVLKEHNLLVETNLNDLNIENIAYHSKEIDSNCIFVCKGNAFKEEYLIEASKKAVAYLSEKKYNVEIPYIITNDVRKAMALVSQVLYDDKSKKINIIGVTGTKGKTTTTNFIKDIISTNENKSIPYMSTIDYYTGKRKGKSHNTTQESVDIFKCIKDAKETNNKHLVMEISSQATKLDRIYNMEFDIGIFLNIGKDHISPLEHSDFEDYLNCKLAFLKKCKTVILYHDIEHYDYILNELKDKNIITYGTKDSDYIVKDIEKKGLTTIFKVVKDNKEREYKINILGDFNALNATAAIIVADLLNIPYHDVVKGILNTQVEGRMNIFNGKCPVIVDYAHNKLSFEVLLKTVMKDFPDHDIKVVFGCPGDRGINRREEMSTLAGKYASYIYLTAEDPQTKKASDICEILADYIKPYNKPYEIITDREQAITKAITDSKPTDIILIVGKGDEDYQIVNGIYEPYISDTKLVEKLTTSKITNK